MTAPQAFRDVPAHDHEARERRLGDVIGAHQVAQDIARATT
jgi:hypothetical protein